MTAVVDHVRPAARSPRRRHAVALGAALLLALPGVAGAATPGNPQVLQIDASSGAQTVLAGGPPWTSLGGIAVGPSGVLYVANEGPVGPNPVGAGIYALTSPGFAITPFVTSAPTSFPVGLVAAGATLYSLDSDEVIAIGTGSTPTQTVLAAGGLYDQLGADPAFGALAGTTLYTTAWGSCDSVAGGGGFVIAVNTSTGAQTLTKSLGCVALGGVAVESAGTLLVAESDTNTVDGGPAVPAKIVRLNPTTGATTTLSTGGVLQSPQGVALDASGDLLVADAKSGLLRIDRATGAQSVVSSGDQLGGANGLAVANGTAYVSEAGVAPTVTASASSPQRFTGKGIRFSAACSRACTVGYGVTIAMKGGSGFVQDAAFHAVSAKRTLTIKLPAQVNTRILRALRARRTVTATIAATGQDPRTGAPGRTVTLRVRLTT
jgi:hypothetical protein